MSFKEVPDLELQKTLEQLCSLPGPSGFEKEAARGAMELLRPLVDEVSINRLGSVVGVRRCGRPGAPKLLLDAHVDEIGIIITGEEDGFLRFCTLGGVDPRMLCDREVTLLTQPPMFGIVSCLPPHVQTVEDMDQSTKVSDLYLDVGLSSAQVKDLIPVGTPGVFRGGCAPLGEDQCCGKALDDRACMASILRALELLLGKELLVDLYILFSTQEETSSAGAITGVNAIRPDICVAVDVTHGETPDSPKEKALKIGGGPAIGVGPNMTRRLTQRLVDLATEKQIDYQLEVMAGHTGTNAWPMQICAEGVATAVVSLPLKYMHTPIEVISCTDLESTARLLAAFVEDAGKEGAHA